MSLTEEILEEYKQRKVNLQTVSEDVIKADVIRRIIYKKADLLATGTRMVGLEQFTNLDIKYQFPSTMSVDYPVAEGARAEHGKVFMQPCMGMREFPAFFRYIPQKELKNEPDPVSYNQDLGFMLYDVFDLRKVNPPTAKPFVSVFKAEITNGTLVVPP